MAPKNASKSALAAAACQSSSRRAIAALSATLPTTTARRLVFPYSFACPAGVLREGGQNTGCTEVMAPWGDAVAG